MSWEEIAGIFGGYARARILHEAVRAGVFDVVRDGATSETVAGEVGWEPEACRILLDALVALGLLERAGDRYRNTEPADRYLREDSELTQVPIIRFNARQWDHWGDLGEALETGEPVRPNDMFQDDPEQLRDFILGMRSIAEGRGDAERVAEVLDLSGADRVLDIGCGPGTYSRRMLEANPGLEAVLFDLPGTLEITREVVAGWPDEIESRVETRAGDFHEDPLPEGCDVAWVSNIVHSESPKANRALLEKIRGVLAEGGRVALKDHVMDPSRTRPKAGATFAVTMLLMTGGRCYTFEEIEAWLEGSGFVDVREVELGASWPQSLVVADRQ